MFEGRSEGRVRTWVRSRTLARAADGARSEHGGGPQRTRRGERTAAS